MTFLQFYEIICVRFNEILPAVEHALSDVRVVGHYGAVRQQCVFSCAFSILADCAACSATVYPAYSPEQKTETEAILRKAPRMQPCSVARQE